MYRGLEGGVAGIRYLVLRDRGKGCAVSHSFVHLSMTDKSKLILLVLLSHLLLDMADDRDGMEASGTRAPRALGHFVFLLINFSDVCSNFISFLQGGKGSGTRVFGQ